MTRDEVKPRPAIMGWADRLARLVGRKPVSREELLEVLRHAQQRRLLDQDSLDMIERVFQVSELRARDIMISRSQMVVVDRDAAPEKFLPIVIESAHSRFPAIDGDRDKVVGIMLAKDLLRYFDEGGKEHFNMRDMLRPAVFVPESKRLNVLLTQFRANRNHMAIVVDEYGGVGGLVTIEDVIEQIVGDIEDEHDIDEEASMIMERGDNEFIVKALLPLEDFNERFGTIFEPEEIDTVGGLIINSLGHVPARGEVVEIERLRFEILNADSRRIHLVKLTRLKELISGSATD